MYNLSDKSVLKNNFNMTWDDFIEFAPRVRHNPPYDVVVPCFVFHPPENKFQDTYHVVKQATISLK